MQGPAGEQVFYCSPKIWIRFIGGLQLFGTILLGIVATPITLTEVPQATDGKYDEEAEEAKQYAKVVVGVIWGVIVLWALVVALLDCFYLEMKRTGFFWPWLIFQGIAGAGAIMVLISGHILLGLFGPLPAVVGGLLIYVVHRRRKEILATQGQTTVGVNA